MKIIHLLLSKRTKSKSVLFATQPHSIPIIPLGDWTDKPIKKNYELVEPTEVHTENRFPLSEIIKHWNVRSIDNLVDICRINGWVVSYDRSNVKSEILTKMKQDEETLIRTLQKFEEKWGKKKN